VSRSRESRRDKTAGVVPANAAKSAIESDGLLWKTRNMRRSVASSMIFSFL
jgi:hypothetical protein